MFVCSPSILSLCWLPRLDFTCMHTPSLPLAGQIAFICFYMLMQMKIRQTQPSGQNKEEQIMHFLSIGQEHILNLRMDGSTSQVAFHRISSLLAGTQWRAPFKPLKYWVTITAVKNIMQQYLYLLWDVIKKLAGAQWHAQFKPPKDGLTLCVQMHSSPLCCEMKCLVVISRLCSIVGFDEI